VQDEEMLMTRWPKFPIGLSLVLAIGAIFHGPLGGGARFVDSLDARADRRLSVVDLPGIAAKFGRAPLSRTATLSGEASEFQREGLGSFPGLNERIETIPGAGGIHWAGEPAPFTLPLIVETLLQLTAAYLVGFLIGRLWFGRRQRTSYLD
jgi:hypothetical protein